MLGEGKMGWKCMEVLAFFVMFSHTHTRDERVGSHRWMRCVLLCLWSDTYEYTCNGNTYS